MTFLSRKVLTRRARDVVTRAGVALVVGVIAAACSTSGHAAAPGTATSTAAPSTAVVTTVAPSIASSTSSTTVLPAAPQASADQAANQMIAAWATADRAGASKVATPLAVNQLFAAPYPGAGLAIPRGCSAAFIPVVCTYGPPGGGSASDSIYQLSVSQSPPGWYVSSVTILP